jgi:uncharacterized membrane protein YkvA (DUF1232 family)
MSAIVKSIIIAVLALAYGASPIDVIPDVLVPFGFGDDAVVLVGAGIAIWRILRARNARKAAGTPAPGSVPTSTTTPPAE